MLIRFGLGGQISGSVAGVVAGHNKGGQYLRNRSIPTNPRSERQQTVRAAFGAAAITWRNLTGGQKAAWEGYANQTPLLNRIGESITVSGFNMYVRVAAYSGGIGISVSPIAPIEPGLSTIGVVTSASLSAADGMTLVTSGADATLTNGCLLQYGPALSPGVSFFNGPYSLFAIDSMLGTGFVDVAQVTPGRYGLPLVGERRPIRVRAMDASGRLSDTFQTIVTVAA